jgi:hypothetical protein
MVMRIVLVLEQAINSTSRERGGEHSLTLFTAPATLALASTECLAGTCQNSGFYCLRDLFAPDLAAALATMSRPVRQGSVSATSPASAPMTVAGI